MAATGSKVPPPPTSLIEVVGGGGLEVGEILAAQLRELSGLRPGDRLLDVGCGVGRTAIPLTSYLSGDGAYEGFDIWPEAIDWCQTEITSRFPHFRFTYVDLFNAAYNPGGRLSPGSFTFPYADEQFDVAAVYSVFTHMLAQDLEHYLSELARVLDKTGRVVATFFLLNEQVLGKLASGRDAATPEGDHVARFLLERDFGPFRGGYEVPEWFVAYDEGFVLGTLRASGFALKESIQYGKWVDWACGREQSLTQDTIVAVRT
jgi:SAM-dependent methyltransferase